MLRRSPKACREVLSESEFVAPPMPRHGFPTIMANQNSEITRPRQRHWTLRMKNRLMGWSCSMVSRVVAPLLVVLGIYQWMLLRSTPFPIAPQQQQQQQQYYQQEQQQQLRQQPGNHHLQYLQTRSDLPPLLLPRAFPYWPSTIDGRPITTNNGTSSSPSPVDACVPPELESDGTASWKSSRQMRPTDKGILYVKVPKCASSTGAGVTLRIAQTLSQQYNQRLANDTTTTTDDAAPIPLCRSRIQHIRAYKLELGKRDRQRSILWTMIRLPHKRLVSQFFHFFISRGDHPSDVHVPPYVIDGSDPAGLEKLFNSYVVFLLNQSACPVYSIFQRKPKTDNTTIWTLPPNTTNTTAIEYQPCQENFVRRFYLTYMTPNAVDSVPHGTIKYIQGQPPTLADQRQPLSSQEDDGYNSKKKKRDFVDRNDASTFYYQQKLQDILQTFDFVGVVERMEESIVVLQLLLGLETHQVMYMSAKQSGAYDDGQYHGQCYFIEPSVVTPGMQDFFDNSEYWKSISFWDDVLYEAVNASLDKTIEETLGGREPGSLFATQYSQFLYWKAKVDERCTGDTVVLPCSKNGTRRDQTDCILADLGCGFDCIDEVFRSNNYFDKQDQRASNP